MVLNKFREGEEFKAAELLKNRQLRYHHLGQSEQF